MDEPTSSLDPENETLLEESAHRLMQGAHGHYHCSPAQYRFPGGQNCCSGKRADCTNRQRIDNYWSRSGVSSATLVNVPLGSKVNIECSGWLSTFNNGACNLQPLTINPQSLTPIKLNNRSNTSRNSFRLFAFLQGFLGLGGSFGAARRADGWKHNRADGDFSVPDFRCCITHRNSVHYKSELLECVSSESHAAFSAIHRTSHLSRCDFSTAVSPADVVLSGIGASRPGSFDAISLG